MKDDVVIAPGVVAHWGFSSGAPVLERSRIATHVLAGRFGSGESIEELASDYRLNVFEVQAAIRYEYLRCRSRKPKFCASRPPGELGLEVIRMR